MIIPGRPGLVLFSDFTDRREPNLCLPQTTNWLINDELRIEERVVNARLWRKVVKPLSWEEALLTLKETCPASLWSLSKLSNIRRNLNVYGAARKPSWYLTTWYLELGQRPCEFIFTWVFIILAFVSTIWFLSLVLLIIASRVMAVFHSDSCSRQDRKPRVGHQTESNNCDSQT